jgi:hypothetical protein
MKSVFIINGIIMCIRDLNDMDIKNSYYDVMNLLSNDIRMIILRGEHINNYKISLIEDMNSHIILGIGTAYINNLTTNLSKIGNINHICIQKKYTDFGLQSKLIDYLQHYCLADKGCIKIELNL